MLQAISRPGRAGSSFRAALFALTLGVGAGGASTGGPSGGDEAFEASRAKLRASDKWARAEGVEELARTGRPEAWELVLGALADPKGEVADTAELLLAGLAHPKAVELLGQEAGLRSKDALVRARVAELLGRLQELPAEGPIAKLLGRALDDDEAEVRRMAAWSIERLMRAGRLAEGPRAKLANELAPRARGERDSLARARALAALVALDPAAGRLALEPAARDHDPLLRGMAAAQVGAAFEPALALARLTGLVADPTASVRRVAVEALAALGTRGGVERLIERLPLETEGRLLARVLEQLQRLSGLKYRRDPRPWRDWLRGLPPDWKPGVPVPVPPEPAANSTQSELAGLPILSKRVAILIDLSGSIWSVRPDGKTRKQLVDEKLRQALQALPPDTRFNLIPYTNEPIPWRPTLVDATPAHVHAAAAWFEARTDNGSGNLWDAALLALADPEVDTLVVLFDGAPTGGTRHRLELLVPLFLERNQARRVATDVVLVDGTKKLQRLWGELCEGTGGRLVAVSF